MKKKKKLIIMIGLSILIISIIYAISPNDKQDNKKIKFKSRYEYELFEKDLSKLKGLHCHDINFCGKFDGEKKETSKLKNK